MSNALTMTGRSLRLSARSPEALLTALLLPVMLMLVFVYLFGGAVSIGTAYVDYVAPGVLLLCAVTGAATTAVTVCQDMVGGIIDRFRSLDVRGTAGPHHADVAARVRRAPAGHAGHRDHPRPAARRLGPRRVRAGLVRRHRYRLDRAVRPNLPPPHRLIKTA
jgi:hypothetical protein